MLDLLSQLNALKGLTDESLQAEVSRPSGGGAPPYLVLSEINRRKDMRERYSADQARRAPQTTVAEDIAGAPGATPPGGMAAVVPPGPQMGGLDAAMPPAAAGSAPPAGFADGGLVDAATYNDVAKKYQGGLDSVEADRKRLLAQTLLAAGAGMMRGEHSNTLQNIGQGLDAGLTTYLTAAKTADSRETDLLRGVTDIAQAQHADALAQIQQADSQRRLDIEQQRADQQAAIDRDPASVRETRAYMSMTPEEQKVYDRQHPPYNPNALTNDMRQIDAANQAFDDALKSLPKSVVPAIDAADIQKQAAEQQKQAAIFAYPKWVAILGKVGADAKLAEYGVSPNDVLLGGGTSAAPAIGKDPAGLGL